VNKVSADTLRDLYAGVIQAEDLKTQTEVAAYYSALESSLGAGTNAAGQGAPPPVTQAQIIQLVSGQSAPAGVVTNGEQIYWGQPNVANNTAEVVSASARSTEPIPQLTKVAYTLHPQVTGVAINHNSVFFASGSSVLKVPQSNNMERSGQEPVAIAQNLAAPRGLAWDHDGTLYIADGGASKSTATGESVSGMVYAVPAGADAAVAVQEVVPVDGVFGVAVVSCADAGIEVLESQAYEGSRWL